MLTLTIIFYYIFKNIFWWGPFLKFLLDLLQYCFCFVLVSWLWDYGILSPQPEIERWSLNHWSSGNFLPLLYICPCTWDYFLIPFHYLCCSSIVWIRSVQFSCSVVSDSATPWNAARQASLSINNSRSPPKPISIESVMPFNHLIFCYPLLLPSIFPRIRVFSNESALLIKWPKYWSFGFNISPSNEYPGLISFRINWLDLFAVQGTLKSLLQHHSSKASILHHSAFFIVQLSYPYWKNYSLD